MTREKIGFIGLGEQGKPMAVNLAKAGFPLQVLDLRPEPVAELVKLGTTAGRSPREIAAVSDIVEIMVLDDAQVEAVLGGDSGVLAGIRKGSVLVVHSTVRPATVRALGKRAEPLGVAVVDAPVSGGPHGGEARTLAYMVGGEADVVARCRPVFETSGSNIQHFGPLGAGLTAKLAHQVVLCLNIMGAYEGMSIAGKAGLDLNQMQAVLRASAGQSRTADNWTTRRPSAHAGRVLRKDLRLALDCAGELGLTLPGAELLYQSIERILAEETPR
jgi:3-hydroxyisobutyrate dehydrogenase-like beta-hydroxyacid dehydrogenase